jgi:hypothetical protein
MSMTRIAAKIAIISFFVMSAIGLAVKQPPFVCAMKSLLGSALVFVAAFVALRMAVNVMVQSVMDNAPPPEPGAGELDEEAQADTSQPASEGEPK